MFPLLLLSNFNLKHNHILFKYPNDPQYYVINWYYGINSMCLTRPWLTLSLLLRNFLPLTT